MIKEFNEPEKKLKLTHKFGTRFKEHDQDFKISTQGLSFCVSKKKSKTNSYITKIF